LKRDAAKQKLTNYRTISSTGVDLSEILGETKILEERVIYVTEESTGVSQLLEHPKSTPMISSL